MVTSAVRRFRRVDMHAHTRFSAERIKYGPLACTVLPPIDPLQLADAAFDAGMDFVTITDHDTIDGGLFLLDRRPELADRFVMGVEVTTWAPESKAEIHLGVYGLDEQQHRAIQVLRKDLLATIAYLRGEGLLYVLNHPIWDAQCRAWTTARLVETIRMIRDHFPVVEGTNGSMLPRQNRLATRFARHFDRIAIGGSDSHTGQIGYTFTEAPGETPAEFLAAIGRGDARVGGRGASTGYMEREAGTILRSFRVFAPRSEKPIARLAGRTLDALAECLHRRMTHLVAQRYIAAQRSTVPEAVRELAMHLAHTARPESTRAAAISGQAARRGGYDAARIGGGMLATA